MSAPKNVNSPLLTPTTRTPTSQGAIMPPSTAKPQEPDSATTRPKPLRTNITPVNPKPRGADTMMSWGAPAGLSIRTNNDENLLIFRKALGINYMRPTTDGGSLEEGRKTATGIYKHVIEIQTRKRTQHITLEVLLYFTYFAQIIIGAALTSLGPTAAKYETIITIMGAVNTVLAGILALVKGSGQPQKVGKDRIAYRRLQDWIEETEALLAVGVIGRNRKEVGLLVESAFKRYNAAKLNEENNDPDYYVNQPIEPTGHGGKDEDDALSDLPKPVAAK
ncbi:hypothetical protein F4780DRAFT_751386 [Xylariomycetidae sp. FL0641]|nr:hypothetical protein F4780DRAFT_751386 [Xylariomycetidae sp. FL0641]